MIKGLNKQCIFLQVIEFVERSSKQPNEASLYKRALEQRLGAILSTYHEALGNANVNPEQVGL